MGLLLLDPIQPHIGPARMAGELLGRDRCYRKAVSNETIGRRKPPAHASIHTGTDLNAGVFERGSTAVPQRTFASG